MGQDVDVPAGLAQRRQVGAGGLAAGNDDEVGIAGERTAGPDDVDADAGLRPQRIEIVEIGDARQARHGNAETAGPPVGSLQRQRVFGGQARCPRQVRHRPEAANASARLDEPETVGEQRRVPLEPVDQGCDDARRVGRVDDREGADQRRDDAAAADIADHHDGNVGGAGKAEIGDVVVAQVDLGGAAGTLHQHQVGIGRQFVEGRQHLRQQRRAPAEIIPRRHRGDTAAADDDLRPGLVLGLEQHRVHRRQRRSARGPCLQRLRPADFAAIGGDGGVVAHVLRLERRHHETAVGERPAQSADDQRFADIRSGAHEHQRARHSGF